MRATDALTLLIGAASVVPRIDVAVETLRRVVIAARKVVAEAEHDDTCAIFAQAECDCDFGVALDILERALG